MVDETLSGGGSAASICPWCSAAYLGDAENCPSCGATLAADAAMDPSLPGLTAIDAAAIVRSKKTTEARPRNRLLSWISGEYPDEGGKPEEAAALAPPDLEVRREILRLELEAEVAHLQADADAMIAEATVEGRVINLPARSVAATDDALGAVDEQAEAMDAAGAPEAAADHPDTTAPVEGGGDPRSA